MNEVVVMRGGRGGLVGRWRGGVMVSYHQVVKGRVANNWV